MMPFPIVGIGASAGGLEAVSEFLAGLPATSGMAFLLVQHLDPHHESVLVELLASKTAMPVQEAADGLAVEPDQVYVIPPNAIMALSQGRLALGRRSGSPLPSMSIDHLLYSLAEEQGASAIGVILSGTGSDGALGMQAIKGAGGITYAQDENTAKFSGMPKAAIELGVVDRVLPPRDIASELARLSRHPYLTRNRSVSTVEPPPTDGEDLHRVFRCVRNVSGVDFTHYKRGTVQRRLARRLVLRGLSTLSEYLNLLENDPKETQALFQDLLIQVTDFFRDPELYEGLTQTVFPRLLESRPPQAPLRIWVPGCASGEEVYSIAICLLEYLGERLTRTPIQIFGTDLSEAAIETARAGLYPENIARHVSDERLRRFFIKVDGHYQITRTIRDLCVFARQDVAHDPPFSRLDLVSCRNLLIYLDPALQKRVIPLFHYALNPGGFLLLGPSETIGTLSELFSPVDKRLKIYSKTILPGRNQLALLEEHHVLPDRSNLKRPVTSSEPVEAERLQREADRLTMARYVPPGVLCDGDMNVLQFRGETTPYLANPAGPPSLKLQKLARPGLLVDLSGAIEQARKDGSPARREGLRVEGPGGPRTLNIEVMPLRVAPAENLWFLIFFEEAAPSVRDQGVAGAGEFWSSLWGRLRAGRDAERATQESEKERQILRLTQELEAARDYIRTMLDAHEAAVEELKAAEEELLSSNEEFQSTNEELETAQEELQSSNDELRARNRELNALNDELRQAHDYAEAVVETGHQPLLVLDKELRVQRANRAFYRSFKTTREATEQGLLYQLGHGQWDIPALRRLLKEILPAYAAFQDEEVTQVFPEIGERTMRLNAQILRWNDQERILLAIEDITEYKAALEALKSVDRRKDEFLSMLAHELRNPLAPIRNALEIWRRGDAGEAAERQAQAMMDRQLRQEARLLDDLLDLSRISRGTIVLKRQPVDLTHLVAQAVDDAYSQIDAHHHRLSLSLPEHAVPVEGDPARLQQIVSNLLNNAIKYTPPGGRITLTLTPEGQDAVLKVADTGIGIGPELLPSIFDLFVQADKSLDRSEGGLGIGLTLVRRLVELHGGRIDARSDGTGKGSEFTVRLPALPEMAIPVAPAETEAAKGTPAVRCRILVVDDNADTAESTALLLQLEGHEVQTAYDGPDAVEAAKTFHPQIVLLDIGLPGLDGYEVARRLRALPELGTPLLVAMTGYGQAEDHDRSQAAGFDEHLVKPVAPDQIKSLVVGYPLRQKTINAAEIP
ncbi:chemotaxis protein CheB [Methylocaldum sp.]|uniref:chemotaxis protein CheB n=1 Tax=Methylocaldum sp. TaxID=1969727 RepID=UPI002D232359|nr:chemotaxis protein CheB [Methylocaldum sp.]HYE36139.1 chemotaxis protein CheB [Methylocaldum sp.]